jgi:hypothetical protein
MDNVIAQMPEAKRQAHERVVGGRQVPSKDCCAAESKWEVGGRLIFQ